jgi:hypothetical protein
VGWVGGQYNNSPVREGYILMINGDTARGLIKFLRYFKRYVNYIPFLPAGKKAVVNVDRSHINCLRL